jgi:hypothetical protein
MTDDSAGLDMPVEGKKRRRITAKRVFLLALGVMLLGTIVGSALDPNPAGAIDMEEGFTLAFKPDQNSIQGRYRITSSALEYRVHGDDEWHSLEHGVTNTKGWGDEIDTGDVFEERGIKVKVRADSQPALAGELGGRRIQVRFEASGLYPGIVAGSTDTFDEYGFSVGETTEYTVRLPAGHPDYRTPGLLNAVQMISGLSALIALALGAFLIVRWLVRRGHRATGGAVAAVATVVGRSVVGGIVDSLDLPSRE